MKGASFKRMLTMKKFVLLMMSLLLAFTAFLSTTSPASAATPFRDINSTDHEIIYLYERGYIAGTSSTTYSPDMAVSREQAATMIGRALKLDGTQRNTSFPDVTKSSYASGYIDSAYKAGFISGYPDGTFKPKEIMTRGEMAHMLSRAFKYSATSAISFKDVPYSTDTDSLYLAVNKIATNGVAAGTGNGYFSPNAELNRRQFAMFIARAINPEFKVSFEMPVIDTYQSTVDALNIRKGPGTSYTIVGKMNKGDQFKVYGIANGWAHGAFGSVTGYVSTSYLSKVPAASDTRIMVIDPGHGGSDPGSVYNGLQEKNVNLNVGLRVESKLKARGITVLMTRRTDVFHSLDYRAAYGAQNGADAFVSIHANAISNSSVNGSETFYSSALDPRAEHSKQLATFIQNRLYKAMEHNNRGVKDADYRVIDKNPLPAALVELGFLTNSSDAYKLGNATYQDAAAQAIADGIVDYYNWRDKQ